MSMFNIKSILLSSFSSGVSFGAFFVPLVVFSLPMLFFFFFFSNKIWQICLGYYQLQRSDLCRSGRGLRLLAGYSAGLPALQFHTATPLVLARTSHSTFRKPSICSIWCLPLIGASPHACIWAPEQEASPPPIHLPSDFYLLTWHFPVLSPGWAQFQDCSHRTTSSHPKLHLYPPRQPKHPLW